MRDGCDPARRHRGRSSDHLLDGRPAKTDYDDRILLRVYDEIIRLSQDPLLVRKVSRLNSYVQFFYLMEDYTEATTQGRH